MLQLLGTVAKVETEDVAATGQYAAFTSTTLHVISGEGRTSFVRISRDFAGEVPRSGESVCLAVWVRPYVQKAKDSLGYGLTAFMRVPLPHGLPVAV